MSKTFKIATFNANSVRARLPIILDWLKANKPDVLCLQETKVQDPDFPVSDFNLAGYHIVFRGQKSYNGVAIASREKPLDVAYGLDDGGPPDEARLISATIGGIPIVNTYVPQGTAVDSPNFKYKLEWFARLGEFFDRHYSPKKTAGLGRRSQRRARTTRRVRSEKTGAGSVCFHPDEHAALIGVKKWGLVDVFRKHRPEEGQFSFWDYRSRGTLERNSGWRLDHILATKPLAAKSIDAFIDVEPRRTERPSDHTFVVAVFKA